MAHSQQKPQPELSSSDSISARSSVLRIPELLENVLAQLPARDLLMCECINKTWHAIIKKSNILQEKLFYKCDLVTLSDDMDESDLEINPFLLLVQRRWALTSNSWRGRDEGVDRFKGLDYPEASWKKMYLSRPAVWKIGLQKDKWDVSISGPSIQLIQHDTIKMNILLDSPQRPLPNVCFSQSDGIRMHHLLGWDLTRVFFLTLNEGEFMVLTNYGFKVPIGCPETSLRQFIDMYVSPEDLQRFREMFAPESDLEA